jgi:hypothetical protein
MTAKGSDLIFISRILRDGSGVELVENPNEMDYAANFIFRLSRLSITKDTWIASQFHVYVVRLKSAEKEDKI